MEEVTAAGAATFGVRAGGERRPAAGRSASPTANLAVWDELLLPGERGLRPRLGQRQEARGGDQRGVRPTVDGLKLTVEAHPRLLTGHTAPRRVSRLEFARPIRPR